MPDALVRQHGGVADVPVNAVRGPPRPAVGAGERRLRGRQIRIDVGDPVDVLGVEILGRPGQAPGQLLVDGEVAAPQLRELEVRIGEGQLEARRRGARHRRRLVGVRIRIERIGKRGIGLDETGEYAGVADLVRDPHVGGPPGEDADPTADLRGVPSTRIEVEAQARGEQQIRPREGAAVVVDRRAARVTESHRIRDGVVIRGVRELRHIDPHPRGQRQVGAGLPLILGVGAGIQHVQRLDRFRQPRDVRVAVLEAAQPDRRGGARGVREVAVGGGIEIRERVEEHVRRVVLLNADAERHRVLRQVDCEVVLELVAVIKEFVIRCERLESKRRIVAAALQNLDEGEPRPIDVLAAFIAGVVPHDKVVGALAERRVPLAHDGPDVLENRVVRVGEIQ